MSPAARHWIALLALAALSAFLQFANVRQTEQGGVVHGDAVKYVFYAYNLKHHDTFSRVQTFGGANAAPSWRGSSRDWPTPANSRVC